MARFDWRRILELQRALDEIRADLHDSIQADSADLHPSLVGSVLGVAHRHYPDSLMDDRSELIFWAYLRLEEASNDLDLAVRHALTLNQLDKLEHRGVWSLPDREA